VTVATAAPAHAQYKNTSFGFDTTAWLIQRPSVTTDTPVDNRPLRLGNAFAFGGETNFKLDVDHWWFTGRVDVAFLTFALGSGGNVFDQAARDALGTLLGIQGGIGIRYFVLTDRVRPYLQAGVSYMRLFTFTSKADETCVGATCSAENRSYYANYLPHPNVGGLHLRPGLEYIVVRDVALHLYVDLQHWIIFNAADNNALVIGIGVTFFT
jgi:hypothetical protein